MDLFWIVFFQVTKCSLHWCVIEIKHNEIKWLKPESVLQIWRRLYDASIIRFEADRSRFTVSYVRLHVGYKRRYKHTYKLRIYEHFPQFCSFLWIPRFSVYELRIWLVSTLISETRSLRFSWKWIKKKNKFSEFLFLWHQSHLLQTYLALQIL